MHNGSVDGSNPWNSFSDWILRTLPDPSRTILCCTNPLSNRAARRCACCGQRTTLRHYHKDACDRRLQLRDRKTVVGMRGAFRILPGDVLVGEASFHVPQAALEKGIWWAYGNAWIYSSGIAVQVVPRPNTKNIRRWLLLHMHEMRRQQPQPAKSGRYGCLEHQTMCAVMTTRHARLARATLMGHPLRLEVNKEKLKQMPSGRSKKARSGL